MRNSKEVNDNVFQQFCFVLHHYYYLVIFLFWQSKSVLVYLLGLYRVLLVCLRIAWACVKKLVFSESVCLRVGLSSFIEVIMYNGKIRTASRKLRKIKFCLNLQQLAQNCPLITIKTLSGKFFGSIEVGRKYVYFLFLLF